MAQAIRKFQNGGSTTPDLYTRGEDKWDRNKLIQAAQNNAQVFLDNNHISGKMADMFNDSLHRAVSGIKNGTFIYNDDGSFTDTTGQSSSTGHRDSNIFGTKDTENNANGYVANYLNSLMGQMGKYTPPTKGDFDLKQQITSGLKSSFHGNDDAYSTWMNSASPLEKATKIKEVMKGLVPQVHDWFDKYNMQGANWNSESDLTNSLNNLINTHSISNGAMDSKFKDLALKSGLDLSDLYGAAPKEEKTTEELAAEKAAAAKKQTTQTTTPAFTTIPYTQDTGFMKLYSLYIKMGRNSTNLTTWIDAGNLKSPVGSYGFANQHKVNNNWQDKGYLSSDYIQRMLNTVDKDPSGNPKAGFFSPAGRVARNNFMTAFNDAANRGDMVTLRDGSMAILPSYDQGRIWVFHNQNDPNPSKRGYMEQVNAFSYPELIPRLHKDYLQSISSKKDGGILKGADGINIGSPVTQDPLKNKYSKVAVQQTAPQAANINAKRSPQQPSKPVDGSRKVSSILDAPLSDPENIRTMGTAAGLGTGTASLFMSGVPLLGSIVGGTGALINLGTDLYADIAEHKSPWANLGMNLAMTAGNVLTNGAGNLLRGVADARKAMAAGKVASEAPSIFKARTAVKAAQEALSRAKTEEEVAAATKALESAKAGVSDALSGITGKLSTMSGKAITGGIAGAGHILNATPWIIPTSDMLVHGGTDIPAAGKLVYTTFTGDPMTEEERQHADRFLGDLAGLTYGAHRALKTPTRVKKATMSEGQRAGTLPQNSSEAIKYRDAVKGNPESTPTQIANAQAQVKANPSNVISWVLNPEAKSYSAGYNGRFGMKSNITPNINGDVSAPVDMDILNNIRKKVPQSSIESPTVQKPMAVKSQEAVISKSNEGTPFVSKVAPNKIYSDRRQFFNPYQEELTKKFNLSPDVVKTIFTEGTKNNKIHASDEYINNVKTSNPELADYLTKMNQEASTKGFKQGGTLRFDGGGSIVSGINNAKDWYNNIHLKYRDQLGSDIAKDPNFYQTVNNLQTRFSDLHTKYPNLNKAYRDPQVDSLQADVKTFTPYVNTLGLQNAATLGNYKTTGLRTSQDSMKSGWKNDSLWGGETDDRRILGRVGDYNPQQLSDETNYWKGKGYNLTADPNTKYYMLNPINTKGTPNNPINPKKSFGPINVNPADALSLGRAISGIGVNNSATDKYVNSLNPVLKSTYELTSPVYGNYIGKSEAEQQAGNLESTSRIPVTSNASLQTAAQLDAASKAGDLRAKGLGLDTDMFYKTLGNNYAIAGDNLKRRSDTGNENLTAMRSMDAAKAGAIYRKDLANYNQIWSPYMAQTEAQLRENNSLNRNLQFQQYQNMYSDLWNSKMANLYKRNKNGEINDDEYTKLAQAERVKQTQGLLGIQKQLFTNPYMISFGQPEMQKSFNFKKGGKVDRFNGEQERYARHTNSEINRHTSRYMATSGRTSKAVLELIKKGMGIKK